MKKTVLGFALGFGCTLLVGFLLIINSSIDNLHFSVSKGLYIVTPPANSEEMFDQAFDVIHTAGLLKDGDNTQTVEHKKYYWGMGRQDEKKGVAFLEMAGSLNSSGLYTLYISRKSDFIYNTSHGNFDFFALLTATGTQIITGDEKKFNEYVIKNWDNIYSNSDSQGQQLLDARKGNQKGINPQSLQYTVYTQTVDKKETQASFSSGIFFHPKGNETLITDTTAYSGIDNVIAAYSLRDTTCFNDMKCKEQQGPKCTIRFVKSLMQGESERMDTVSNNTYKQYNFSAGSAFHAKTDTREYEGMIEGKGDANCQIVGSSKGTMYDMPR